MLIWKLFHYSRKFIILLYTHSLFVILIIKIRYDFCNYYITLIFFFFKTEIWWSIIQLSILNFSVTFIVKKI